MLCMGFKPYDSGRSRIHWAMAAALRQQTSETFYFLKNGPSPVHCFKTRYSFFHVQTQKVIQPTQYYVETLYLPKWVFDPRIKFFRCQQSKL